MSVLTGYRVLDCSIATAGLMATTRLGDLGADVIKIEPVTGEWHRHVANGGAQGKSHQRVVHRPQPEQALPRDQPQSRSRTADHPRPRRHRRRVRPELPPGRRRPAVRGLRHLARDQPASGVRVHVRVGVLHDLYVLQNDSLLSYDHPSEGRVVTPGFPIKFGKTPSALRRPTPQLGEHTREVLSELGFGDRIDILIEGGVVASDDAKP